MWKVQNLKALKANSSSPSVSPGLWNDHNSAACDLCSLKCQAMKTSEEVQKGGNQIEF